ncbi:MAG TPA: hypothetical protein VFQ00_09680 [Terriglobales bacterium]|nr:hypothetical protein [Terriglobales bacterium]
MVAFGVVVAIAVYLRTKNRKPKLNFNGNAKSDRNPKATARSFTPAQKTRPRSGCQALEIAVLLTRVVSFDLVSISLT